MIKKILDKDKQDWEDFLKNKNSPSNKNIVKKNFLSDRKIVEISDKNKQDWKNFLNNKEKLPDKDFVNKKI